MASFMIFLVLSFLLSGGANASNTFRDILNLEKRQLPSTSQQVRDNAACGFQRNEWIPIPDNPTSTSTWASASNPIFNACVNSYNELSDAYIRTPPADLGCADGVTGGFCVLVCAPVTCTYFQLKDASAPAPTIESAMVATPNRWTWIRLGMGPQFNSSRRYTITTNSNSLISRRIYFQGILFLAEQDSWLERHRFATNTFGLSGQVATLTAGFRHVLPQTPCVDNDLCYVFDCTIPTSSAQCDYITHIYRDVINNIQVNSQYNLALDGRKVQWVRMRNYCNQGVSPLALQNFSMIITGGDNNTNIRQNANACRTPINLSVLSRMDISQATQVVSSTNTAASCDTTGSTGLSKRNSSAKPGQSKASFLWSIAGTTNNVGQSVATNNSAKNLGSKAK